MYRLRLLTDQHPPRLRRSRTHPCLADTWFVNKCLFVLCWRQFMMMMMIKNHRYSFFSLAWVGWSPQVSPSTRSCSVPAVHKGPKTRVMYDMLNQSFLARTSDLWPCHFKISASKHPSWLLVPDVQTISVDHASCYLQDCYAGLVFADQSWEGSSPSCWCSWLCEDPCLYVHSENKLNQSCCSIVC